MKHKTFGKKALLSLAVAALCGSGQLLAQDCDGNRVSVKGKIFNNGQIPGSLFSTLGVVALNGGDPIGKMKCGIVGIPGAVTDPNFPLVFTHTISCDDAGSLFPGGPATHSQLTFDTKGTFTQYPEYCPGGGGISAPFIEYSAPKVGSGRGVFTNTLGGLLTIEGTINCAGTIDMKFSGEVCLGQTY